MRNAIIRTVTLSLTLALAAIGCSDISDKDTGSKGAATSGNAGAPSKGVAGYETKCNPACTGTQHCELLLQECNMASCPWIPTCADGIDPCATVSCPSVCAVASDHRHRCVSVP